MSELVRWVNTEAFNEDDSFIDLANFHATFIKIHPFRLLTYFDAGPC